MKTYLTFAAVAAVFVFAAAAQADDTPTNGVSLRIGASYPLQDGTRNNSGSYWLAAGFDYKIPSIHIPGADTNNGYFSLSLDYTGKGNYSNVPLLLNFTEGKVLYASVGLGVSFSAFPQDDGNQNTKVRFAYTGAIGYNLPSTGQIPMFLELRYFGNDQPRLSVLAAYIGARF